MSVKTLEKNHIALDGRILNVVSGELGNAVRRFTYIDWLRNEYYYGSILHFITATTLTIEVANSDGQPGQTITGAADATDGTGATLADASLNAVSGFNTNTDLIGQRVRITADTTTTANVGQIRTVSAYTAVGGVMTLDLALGATTSGITEFVLEDTPNSIDPFARMVSDPPSSQWRDVTALMTGAATATTSGTWQFSGVVPFERMRINRLTTNATNALALDISRTR